MTRPAVKSPPSRHGCPQRIRVGSTTTGGVHFSRTAERMTRQGQAGAAVVGDDVLTLARRPQSGMPSSGPVAAGSKGKARSTPTDLPPPRMPMSRKGLRSASARRALPDPAYQLRLQAQIRQWCQNRACARRRAAAAAPRRQSFTGAAPKRNEPAGRRFAVRGYNPNSCSPRRRRRTSTHGRAHRAPK